VEGLEPTVVGVAAVAGLAHLEHRSFLSFVFDPMQRILIPRPL
jgi:hypothetical protein